MNRTNKLAIFDIDGTIFRKNLHFELINELVWLGIFPKHIRGNLIKLYTGWLEHKGTYESYRKSLVELYEKYIVGKKVEDINLASEMFVAFHKNRTYLFAEKLIKKFKLENYHIIAVSGSPIEAVKEFNKAHLHFDKVFGTVYENKKGLYTGREEFTPVKDKGETVKQYVYENDLTLEGSYGIGDTESDAKFLELVSNPIVFNPNQNLKTIAEKNRWPIKVERKDIIYNIK